MQGLRLHTVNKHKDPKAEIREEARRQENSKKLEVGEIHRKMNFFGIKFGWSNFSENTIQCVGISPPKMFFKTAQ